MQNSNNIQYLLEMFQIMYFKKIFPDLYDNLFK